MNLLDFRPGRRRTVMRAKRGRGQVGPALRRLRVLRELKATDVARRSKRFSAQRISAIESGDSEIQEGTIFAYLDAIDASLYDLAEALEPGGPGGTDKIVGRVIERLADLALANRDSPGRKRRSG